jgi:hypothetical protein
MHQKMSTGKKTFPTHLNLQQVSTCAKVVRASQFACDCTRVRFPDQHRTRQQMRHPHQRHAISVLVFVGGFASIVINMHRNELVASNKARQIVAEGNLHTQIHTSTHTSTRARRTNMKERSARLGQA